MKAFPTTIDNEGYQIDHQGMDLRDYFAAKALPLSYQFWMHDYFEFDFDDGDENRGISSNTPLIAETAYSLADAMMKARG
jgi:hypothetical protein